MRSSTITPRRRYGRRSAVALSALLLIALTGCSSDEASSHAGGDASSPAATEAASGASSEASEAAEAETGGTLRVGEVSGLALHALLTAAGEDKDFGYQVEWLGFPGGGPEFMEAARGGSADLASMATTPLLAAQIAGTPVKAVAAKTTMAPGEAILHLVVPDDSPAQTVQDLAGKKISSTQGTVGQFTLVGILKRAGLSLDDIEPVNLTPPDGVAALRAGQTDAMVISDPFLGDLIADGFRTIDTSEGVFSGAAIWVATDEALSTDAGAANVRDFIERTKRAEQWADTHPEEWSKVYAEAFDLDPAVALALVKRQKSTYIPVDETVIGELQAQADLFADLELLPERVDVSSMFDSRFNDVLPGA